MMIYVQNADLPKIPRQQRAKLFSPCIFYKEDDHRFSMCREVPKDLEQSGELVASGNATTEPAKTTEARPVATSSTIAVPKSP